MTTTILYHPAGHKSAKKLAAKLEIGKARHSKPPHSKVSQLIRWGSAAKLPFTPDVELNPRSSLVNYKGRSGQLEKLSGADVPVPKFTTDPFEAAAFDAVMYHGPTNGKNKMSGRGLQVLSEPSQLGEVEPTLFVDFLPKHRQFRVHVFRIGEEVHTRTRELIHTSEITKGPDGKINAFTPNPEARSSNIWNYGSGFRYMVVQGHRPNGVIPSAVAALDALSLDFGAVDLIVTPSQHPYVLEVNTAPGLGPLTLDWYAERISTRLSLKQKTS